MWAEPPPVTVQASHNSNVQLPPLPALDQVPSTRKETKKMTIGAGFIVKQELIPETATRPAWSFTGRSCATSSTGTPKVIKDGPMSFFQAAEETRPQRFSEPRGLTSTSSAPSLLPRIEEKTLLSPMSAGAQRNSLSLSPQRQGSRESIASSPQAVIALSKSPQSSDGQGVLDYQMRGFLPEVDQLRKSRKAGNQYANVPSRLNLDLAAEKKEKALQAYVAIQRPLLRKPEDIIVNARRKGLKRQLPHASELARKRAEDRTRSCSLPVLVKV